MIPLKLTLKNFMSYSEYETMDFTRFHVAVIIGQNGNGKSSLWDAITWCIWGRARGLDAAGRGSDDLIRIGADEMEVEFLFKIDNTKYRILRKKKRNSNSILEFNIINDDGTLKSLTQEKIEDTKEKIENTIMLDYDTFVSSSFMPQNKSGFFSEADPTKRKQIFSEVLGLDIYDKLQEKAKMKRSEYEKNIAIIDEQLKLYLKEIENKDEIINQKVELSQKYNNKKIEIDNLTKEMDILQENKRKMDDILIKYKEYSERIKLDEKVISEYDSMIIDLENKIRELKELLNKEDEIVNGYNIFKSLQDQLEELDAKYIKFNEFEKEKINIKNKINIIRRENELLLNNLKIKYNETLDKYKKLEADGEELKALEEKMKEFDSIDDDLLKNEEKIQEYNEKLAELKAEFNSYNKKIDELKENYTTISNTDATCPVCNSPLDDDKKNNLLNDFTEKINNYKKQIIKIKDLGIHLQDELKKLKNDRAKLKILQKQKDKLNININTIKNNLSEKDSTLVKLKELDSNIKELTNILNNNDYANDEKNKLKYIDNMLLELNFSLELYKETKDKYEKYKNYEKLMERLSISKQNIEDHKNTYDTYKKNINIYRENLNNDKKTMEYFKEQSKGYDNLVNDIKNLKNKIEKANKDYLDINVRLTSILDKIKNIENIEIKINELKKERDRNLKERHYYEILEYSFSKKGIQALIIENALPEFEDTANNLLAKLTDGKMYVSLITQKTNKSGSVQETLDIEISDELGKRKYELYSGGEAFRINFALRIALSKLLSKRAGVKLQTLIIDEGFGSQDKIGRQNIIDVINMIKDEFELVVVITHIDEFKDIFPYTIEITKDENGSHIIYA